MNALATPNTVAADPRFGALDRLFFVIGAQKAGTTWVQHYLAKHPQVCVPEFKELNYWAVIREGRKGSRVLERRLAEVRNLSLPLRLLSHVLPSKRMKSYRLVERMLAGERPGHAGYADALFQTSKGQRIAGEINPQYALLSGDTLAEMSVLAKDVRFVFLMRDPVSRLFSGLRHSAKHRYGEDGITDARLRDMWEAALKQNGSAALARSRYDETIKTLEAAVPADKIAYFFFESLFDQAEIDRLTRFIGADTRPADVDNIRHEGAGKKIAMPADLAERSLALLAPTYEFMRARFGDQIPASWRKPKQGADTSAPKTGEA